MRYVCPAEILYCRVFDARQICFCVPFVLQLHVVGDKAMSKSAMVRARVEPELKDRVESVFHRLGLNSTQAITMFYKQVELRDGLPFDVVIPSVTTRKTMEKTDAGRDLVVCRDADDMFDKLGI